MDLQQLSTCNQQTTKQRQSADHTAEIMHIPSGSQDIVIDPPQDRDWPKDHDLLHDMFNLPPGLLSYKPVSLSYGGLLRSGILCLVISEVHQDFYARFLNIRDGEMVGEKNTMKAPWTLIHPVMGPAWIQTSRINRRTPTETFGGERPAFLAFVDNMDAFLKLQKLGECSMDGAFVSPTDSDIILAFPSHKELGTTTSSLLRDKQYHHSPPIKVYPPCPVDSDLARAARTFLEEGDKHKHGQNLMPMKTWTQSLFKPWTYSRGTVKPKLAMGAQMGNVTMMSKEEWVHFVHYKNVDDPREVETLFFQPIFAERPVVSTGQELAGVLSSDFKSRDAEAEKESRRAQEEIERLAAKGYVAEPEGPIFYDRG